jgi:DNA-binding CsgD family transcriptional regulator
MTEQSHDRGRERLTPRQREITSLVARGYTNQQISTELVISRGTVGNHVEQILRRLELGSRVELATWASQHGLATTQDRLVITLERPLEIDSRDLDVALDAATGAVAEVLGVEKVDALLYDPATATLVARGTSPTPLGHKQHALRRHLLPVANGGRVVEVYETGIPRRAGRAARTTVHQVPVGGWQVPPGGG